MHGRDVWDVFKIFRKENYIFPEKIRLESTTRYVEVDNYVELNTVHDTGEKKAVFFPPYMSDDKGSVRRNN